MFPKAKSIDKRLKLLLWGGSGVGKTVLSLQFPGVCLIDADKGSDHYADDFDFGIERPQSFVELMKLVEWLAKGDHEFVTLVIDQMSWVWEVVQEKWRDALMAKRKIRDAAQFSFAFGDWKFIKGEHKLLIRRLHSLDMNVILLARSKTEYSDTEMAKATGDKPDCENNLPYEMDTVCHLRREVRQGGEEFYFALQSKDRTHKLPKTEFEFSADMFLQLLGPRFNKAAGRVELPPSQDELDAEKVERLQLIQEIKEVKVAWNERLDGSWGTFRERHIGLVNGKDMTLKHLQTLKEAIMEKLAEGKDLEAESQETPAPPPKKATKQKTAPPKAPPLKPELTREEYVALSNSKKLLHQQKRIGWDAFNSVYSKLCGSRSSDKLEKDILEALITTLEGLPDSLAKGHKKKKKVLAAA